jgi:hypothetical protein
MNKNKTINIIPMVVVVPTCAARELGTTLAQDSSGWVVTGLLVVKGHLPTLKKIIIDTMAS